MSNRICKFCRELIGEDWMDAILHYEDKCKSIIPRQKVVESIRIQIYKDKRLRILELRELATMLGISEKELEGKE